ncbi:MAG: PrsW family glutamic-type intramembrane protease [Eubacteriales bacterium]|nr:PrsW family glutamic-type intramembrane protease [Eubacteriales bacterium]
MKERNDINSEGNARSCLNAAPDTALPPNTDLDPYQKKTRRRKTAALFALILLLALGILNNQGDYLGRDKSAAGQYLEVYSACLLLLAYIVPFVIFMRWLCRRYKLRRIGLLLAAFCGAFIPTPFAGWLNDDFTHMMSHWLGHSYSDDWMGSVEVGIVEELLKLGTTALILYVLEQRSLKNYISIGMSVGIGFQIEEDISDITTAGFMHLNDAFPAALERVSGSLGSHWSYAAVTAAGLYLIVTAKGDKRKRLKGFGLIALVMADHFAYDTPIGEINLFNALLAVAVLLPLVLIIQSPEMKKESGE